MVTTFNTNRKVAVKLWILIASIVLLNACNGNAANAKEYLVGVNRPNNLFVIDVDKQQVIQNCDLPGRFGLGTVALSPDNRIAYVLNNGSEDVYGVALDNCKLVFQARQSQGNIRVKSMASIALSRDGKELYTVQLRTQLLPDQLTALEPRFAVYSTTSGLDAKPVRSFAVPRQITTLAVGKDGTVYASGPDFYGIDPQTGEVEVVLAGRSFEQPLHTNPDGATNWNIGGAVNEFLRPYLTVKFADESYSMETAQPIWGYMRVDLETGESIRTEVGNYQSMIFSGATHPKKNGLFYGVLNQLQKYDVEARQLVNTVDLDHAYYCLVFSPKGDKIYLGGTLGDIAIYDPETLMKLGNIDLPGGGDMAMSSFQVFSRP